MPWCVCREQRSLLERLTMAEDVALGVQVDMPPQGMTTYNAFQDTCRSLHFAAEHLQGIICMNCMSLGASYPPIATSRPSCGNKAALLAFVGPMQDAATDQNCYLPTPPLPFFPPPPVPPSLPPPMPPIPPPSPAPTFPPPNSPALPPPSLPPLNSPPPPSQLPPSLPPNFASPALRLAPPPLS